jgi:hypothetical protein
MLDLVEREFIEYKIRTGSPLSLAGVFEKKDESEH